MNFKEYLDNTGSHSNDFHPRETNIFCTNYNVSSNPLIKKILKKHFKLCIGRDSVVCVLLLYISDMKA